jgi:hypothetical protein
MDLCLQLIFNEFQAPGHWQYRQCAGCYFFDFLSHFDGTGIGLAAAGWTCVRNSFSMNLTLQGTAGTGSVLVEHFFIFFSSFLSHWIRPSS